MFFYLCVSLAVVGVAFYELISGKSIPSWWKDASRKYRPFWYWLRIMEKLLLALGILYLANHHLLPGLP